MPEFTGIGLIGWIVIGFLAGALSGLVVQNRTPGGCLANILVGVLGGIIGGVLTKQFFNESEVAGWVGALVVAFVGAVIVRYLLALISPANDRRW